MYLFTAAWPEDISDSVSVSGSDSDASLAIVQANSRYLFRVPACLDQPQYVRSSLSSCDKSMPSLLMPTLSIVSTHSGMAKDICGGRMWVTKDCKIWFPHQSSLPRKYCSHFRQWKNKKLRKGQAHAWGGQGSQTMLRTTGWTRHHVKLHQFSQTLPWKYDMVDGEKKNCVGKLLRFKQRSQWSHSRATPWN